MSRILPLGDFLEHEHQSAGYTRTDRKTHIRRGSIPALHASYTPVPITLPILENKARRESDPNIRPPTIRPGTPIVPPNRVISSRRLSLLHQDQNNKKERLDLFESNLLQHIGSSDDLRESTYKFPSNSSNIPIPLLPPSPILTSAQCMLSPHSSSTSSASLISSSSLLSFSSSSSALLLSSCSSSSLSLLDSGRSLFVSSCSSSLSSSSLSDSLSSLIQHSPVHRPSVPLHRRTSFRESSTEISPKSEHGRRLSHVLHTPCFQPYYFRTILSKYSLEDLETLDEEVLQQIFSLYASSQSDELCPMNDLPKFAYDCILRILQNAYECYQKLYPLATVLEIDTHVQNEKHYLLPSENEMKSVNAVVKVLQNKIDLNHDGRLTRSKFITQWQGIVKMIFLTKVNGELRCLIM